MEWPHERRFQFAKWVSLVCLRAFAWRCNWSWALRGDGNNGKGCFAGKANPGERKAVLPNPHLTAGAIIGAIVRRG